MRPTPRTAGAPRTLGWLLLLALAALVLPLRAQTPFHRHFGTRDGLAQYTVSLIAEDACGYLWFGTESGVSRFDGVEFFTYSLQNGFTNAPVQALVPLDGSAYALARGQLFLLEGETGRQVRLPEYAYFAFQAEGETWLLYEHRIANLKGDKTFPCPPHTAFTRESIPRTLPGPGTFTLVLGTEVYRFQGSDGLRLLGRLPAAPEGLVALPDGRLGAIAKDRLLALGPGGEVEVVWVAPRGMVLTCGTSEDRTVLLANQVGQVVELEDGREKAVRGGLDAHAARAAYLDREKNLWLGFDSGGLVLMPKVRFTSFSTQDGLGSGDCFFVAPDPGRGGVWVGTRNGGAAHIDPAGRVRPYRKGPGGLSTDKVRGLFINRQGIVHIGTLDGIARVGADGRALMMPFSRGHTFRSLAQDAGGAMLAGTQEGRLFRWKEGEEAPREVCRLPINTQIRFLCEFEGRIYIGAQQGLFAWDGTRLAQAPGFQGQKVNALFVDREAGLTVVTEEWGVWRQAGGQWRQRVSPSQIAGFLHGGVEAPDGILYLASESGLLLLDARGLRRLSRKDGLNSETIYLIGFDPSGRAWIGGNQGINTLEGGRITASYDYRDGLADNETNGFGFAMDAQGHAWFCTMNGISRIQPSRVLRYELPPRLALRRVDVNGEVQPGFPWSGGRGRRLDLANDQNSLRFSFSGIHHANPNGVRYQYQLEGFDQGWSVPTADRFTHYPKLPPGDYRFLLRCTNAEGVSSATTVLDVRIRPAVWQRLWFRILCILGALGGIGWAVHLRIRAIQRRNEQLEALVAERTQQLREATLTDPLTGLRNRRFITEILQTDAEAFMSFKRHLVNAPNARQAVSDKGVYGLFLLDMDHFKQVNDAHGHDAGDHVLRQFARILKHSVRRDDAVMRIGGEEFLVVLKETDPAFLHAFASKLLAKVAATPFDLGDGTVLHKTCSIGYTSFPLYLEAPDLLSFEQSIMVADLGMYCAKRQGRNRAVFLSAGERIPTRDEVLQKTVTALEFALSEKFLEMRLSEGGPAPVE